MIDVFSIASEEELTKLRELPPEVVEMAFQYTEGSSQHRAYCHAFDKADSYDASTASKKFRALMTKYEEQLAILFRLHKQVKVDNKKSVREAATDVLIDIMNGNRNATEMVKLRDGNKEILVPTLVSPSIGDMMASATTLLEFEYKKDTLASGGNGSPVQINIFDDLGDIDGH